MSPVEIHAECTLSGMLARHWHLYLTKKVYPVSIFLFLNRRKHVPFTLISGLPSYPELAVVFPSSEEKIPVWYKTFLKKDWYLPRQINSRYICIYGQKCCSARAMPQPVIQFCLSWKLWVKMMDACIFVTEVFQWRPRMSFIK